MLTNTGLSLGVSGSRIGWCWGCTRGSTIGVCVGVVVLNIHVHGRWRSRRCRIRPLLIDQRVSAQESIKSIERTDEARWDVLARLGAVGERHDEDEQRDGHVRIVRQFVQKVRSE